jgi:chromosome segregation ATPase
MSNLDINIRPHEKDVIISQLKQDLNELRGMERDYKGVTDDIEEIEGKLMQVSDEKLVAESKIKLSLDQDFAEMFSLREQIEDLKAQLSDKEAKEYELQDQLFRANRLENDKLTASDRLKDQVTLETAKVNELQALFDSQDK